MVGYALDGPEGRGYTLKMLEPLPDEYFMREALRQGAESVRSGRSAGGRGGCARGQNHRARA